jgi:enterochelin esterase-like enzyme
MKNSHLNPYLFGMLGRTFLVSALTFANVAVAEPSCSSTVTGDLRIESFQSHIFPSIQTLRIWLPPGYTDRKNIDRTYPVLYMLDGQNLFDVCPSMNHDEWQIDETLTRLITSGRIPPIIVVGIDAPDDGPLRAAEFVPYPDHSSPFEFTPNGQHFPQFLTSEVLPRISAKYRVKSGRANTAIGGASYGAIAALYALLSEPQAFGMGLIESPWTTPGNGELVRESSQVTLPPLRVAVGVGDREAALYAEPMRKRGFDPDLFSRNLANDARTIADNFRQSGGKAIAVQFTEVPDGQHDEQSWRQRFEHEISFLFPTEQP